MIICMDKNCETKTSLAKICSQKTFRQISEDQENLLSSTDLASRETPA